MTTPTGAIFPLGLELPVATDAVYSHLRKAMPTADLKYVDPKEMVIRVLAEYGVLNLVQGTSHPATLPDKTFSLKRAIGDNTGQIMTESDLKVSVGGTLLDVTPERFAVAIGDGVGITAVAHNNTLTGNGASTPLAVATAIVAQAIAGANVTFNSTTGKLDVAASGGSVTLTGSAQMPAEKTRDDSALTPAGAAKLVEYLKPVAVSGALSAAQQSAAAIEVPMLSNFSCNGGTRGAPSFIVPVAGGGSCAIDLGNLPYRPNDWSPPASGGVTPLTGCLLVSPSQDPGANGPSLYALCGREKFMAGIGFGIETFDGGVSGQSTHARIY